MGLFSKKKGAEMSDSILLGNTEFVFDSKLGFYVGEWIVWERKTKILLEIKSTEGNIGGIILEKINWINGHKNIIIQSFLEENDDYIDTVNEMIEDGALEADGKISEDEFVKALFVNNVTVFVNGIETGFYIDLDAEPDYFMGHLACIEKHKRQILRKGQRPQRHQKGDKYLCQPGAESGTSWKMITCARRSGATSSILPPVTAKVLTMRAGQPFAWTVWKYCGATTTPISRMCGRNFITCGPQR